MVAPASFWDNRVGILILSMSPYDAELGLPSAGGLDTCLMTQDALGHPLRSNRPGADLPDVIHSIMSLVAGLRGSIQCARRPGGHLEIRLDDVAERSGPISTNRIEALVGAGF